MVLLHHEVEVTYNDGRSLNVAQQTFGIPSTKTIFEKCISLISNFLKAGTMLLTTLVYRAIN